MLVNQIDAPLLPDFVGNPEDVVDDIVFGAVSTLLWGCHGGSNLVCPEKRRDCTSDAVHKP